MLLATCAAAQAQTSDDTYSVEVFRSWDAIFDNVADTTVLTSRISAKTEFDIHIEPQNKKDKKVKVLLKDSTVAVHIDSTLWLISSDYIKREFKGDCQHFSHFVPLYFSPQIAFVQWQPNRFSMGRILLSGFTLGIVDLTGDPGEVAPYYLLDFDDMTVKKVDSDLLLQLLDDMPRLKRRYEQMADNQEQYMINEFFLDYVQALGS